MNTPEVQTPLPVETILKIMARSPIDTIQALMQTCKALQDEGLKILIHHGVVLRSGSAVTSFVDVMFSKEGLYFAYFRRLTITYRGDDDSWPTQECWGDDLSRLLLCPKLHLRMLLLNSSALLFQAQPRVHDAFIGLSTLTHLVVDDVFAEHTSAFLHNLRSPLDTVCLSLITAHIINRHGQLLGGWLPGTNPLSILARVAGTLQTLSWTQEDYSEFPLAQDIPLAQITLRFPRLHTFHLRYGLVEEPFTDDSEMSADVPNVSPFLIGFPNLAVFSIMYTRASKFDDDADANLRARERTQAARTAIARGWSSKKAEPRLWPALKELSGDLRSLYVVAYEGPVDTLRVWACPAFASESILNQLRIVVEETRPTVLELEVFGWRSSATSEAADTRIVGDECSVIDMLGRCRPCSIRSLRMKVLLDLEDPQLEFISNVDDILNDIISALGPIPREISSLELLVDLRSRTARLRNTRSMEASSEPQSHVRDMAISAQLVSNAIPTLRDLK